MYSVTELHEVRTQLEIPAVGLAAERRRETQLTSLSQIVDALAACEELREWVRLDAAFHVSLADASGNRVLAGLIEHLRELLIDQSISVVQFEGRIEQANVEHREIFDAVAAQDRVGARRAMSTHLLNVIGSEAVGALTPTEQDLLQRIDEARPRIVETVKTLVAFETPNPPGHNEARAQDWISDRLASIGMSVDVFDVLPGRPDVVGRLPGAEPEGRSVLFNGHIDVAELRAPEAWSHPPFDAIEQNGRVYGLGSSDMKSAHAGFLVMLECLRAAGIELSGDVVYESVIGEEAGEPGTAACVERGIRADFAIVGECSRAESVIVSSVGAINLSVVAGLVQLPLDSAPPSCRAQPARSYQLH